MINVVVVAVVFAEAVLLSARGSIAGTTSKLANVVRHELVEVKPGYS